MYGSVKSTGAGFPRASASLWKDGKAGLAWVTENVTCRF